MSYVKFTYKRSRIFMESDDISILDFVKTQHMVENKTAKIFFDKKYIPKFICPISELYSFQSGMFYDIVECIKHNFPDTVINWSEVKSIVNPFPINNVNIIQPENQYYKYLDYQEEAIKLGLQYGRGCFDLATASGKSLMIYGLLINSKKYRNFKRFLLVVPNIQLVHQFSKDVREYGYTDSICLYTGDVDNIYEGQELIITNRQYLNQNKLNIPFDCIFLDEAHGFSSQNQTYKYIDETGCNCIYGFTGSMPNKNELEKLWKLKGLCGKVLLVKKSKDLQADNVLPEIGLVTIKIEHNNPPPPTHPQLDIEVEEARQKWNSVNTKNTIFGEAHKCAEEIAYIKAKQKRAKARFPIEWKHIEEHEASNKIITDITFSVNNNIILLFDHIQHGKILFDMLTKLNVNNEKTLFYIDGNVNIDLREEARPILEANNNCIVVANTKCFSTGINIKNIFHIVFGFGSGKAAAKILQSVGRGLRRLSGKSRIIIYDIYHDYKYSTDHFNHREQLYKENYTISKKINKKFVVD